MDKGIIYSIAENAGAIEKYAETSKRLRHLAQTIVGPSRKELLAIADELEQLPEALFKPPLLRAYQIRRKRWRSYAEIAQQLKISQSTARQTVQALRQSGAIVEFSRRRVVRSAARSSRGGLQPAPATVGVNLQPVKGAEFANEGRSNDERIAEIVGAIETAVANLSQQYDWQRLSVRSKIQLLKDETKKSRGVAVSSQTLYRDWVRSLW